MLHVVNLGVKLLQISFDNSQSVLFFQLILGQFSSYIMALPGKDLCLSNDFLVFLSFKQLHGIVSHLFVEALKIELLKLLQLY